MALDLAFLFHQWQRCWGAEGLQLHSWLVVESAKLGPRAETPWFWCSVCVVNVISRVWRDRLGGEKPWQLVPLQLCGDVYL